MNSMFDVDPDYFIVGNNETDFKSFGFNIPKLCDYLKKTGKKFEDLTTDELEEFRSE